MTAFRDIVLLTRDVDEHKGKTLYVTALREGGKFVKQFVENMRLLTKLIEGPHYHRVGRSINY